MSTHKKLGYFDAKFDVKEPCPTSFRYIIFSSQRTGSNYICSRLVNLKDACGIPMEYLLPSAFETFRNRLAHGVSSSGKPGKMKFSGYIKLVEAARTTPDGCFGIKVQPWQLLHLTEESPGGLVNFLNRFDRLIFMTRRDKLAQAVSGAIAQQLTDKPSMHIHYEDLQHDPDAVFRSVVEFLGVRDMASMSEEALIQTTKKSTMRFWITSVAAALRHRHCHYPHLMPDPLRLIRPAR